MSAADRMEQAIAAFKSAWTAKGMEIGRGISEPGTKTRAGLEAAAPFLAEQCNSRECPLNKSLKVAPMHIELLEFTGETTVAAVIALTGAGEAEAAETLAFSKAAGIMRITSPDGSVRVSEVSASEMKSWKGLPRG